MTTHGNRYLTIILLCLLLSAPTGIAVAVPVNYSETLSGDLPQFGAPLPTFSFDIGVNTVSGRFGAANDFSSEVDSFAFAVPAGTRLVAGQVTTVDAIGNVLYANWSLRAGSANYNGGTFLEALIPLSPGSHVIASTPLEANSYNVSDGGSFAILVGTPAFSDYRFTFVLRPIVPEPGSAGLWLLTTGWALLRRPRRRRQMCYKRASS